MKEDLKERDIELGELSAVGEEVLALLRARKSEASARLVALSGPLGAGKTTLSQEIAKKLGVKESMQSPTFVIQKRYQTTDRDYTQLVHIDAYRLENERELEVLRFTETVSDPHTLILLEWPERVPSLLPQDTLWVYLEHVSEIRRHVRYEWST